MRVLVYIQICSVTLVSEAHSIHIYKITLHTHIQIIHLQLHFTLVNIDTRSFKTTLQNKTGDC
jgi:hypothetical protein